MLPRGTVRFSDGVTALIAEAEELWDLNKADRVSQDVLAASLNIPPRDAFEMAYEEHLAKTRAAADKKGREALTNRPAELKAHGKVAMKQQTWEKPRPRVPATNEAVGVDVKMAEINMVKRLIQEAPDEDDEDEEDQKSNPLAARTGNTTGENSMMENSEEEARQMLTGSGKKKPDAAAAPKQIVKVDEGKPSGPARKKQRVEEGKGGRKSVAASSGVLVRKRKPSESEIEGPAVGSSRGAATTKGGTRRGEPTRQELEKQLKKVELDLEDATADSEEALACFYDTTRRLIALELEEDSINVALGNKPSLL